MWEESCFSTLQSIRGNVRCLNNSKLMFNISNLLHKSKFKFLGDFSDPIKRLRSQCEQKFHLIFASFLIVSIPSCLASSFF